MNPEGFLDTDSASYIAVAADIARNGTYSSGGVPEHSRTPGLPFSLAPFVLLNAGIPLYTAFQILFSAALCLLVMLLTREFTGSMRGAVVAGLICALDVPSIVMANLVMTETIFAFLLFLSVCLVFRKNLPVIFSSGIAMGAALLYRPVAAYLPAVMILFILLSNKYPLRKKAMFAGIFLAGCTLIVSPWLLRNRIVFGSPFLSTISSKNMLYYRAAGVHSVKHDIPFVESQELLSEEVRNALSEEEVNPVSRAALEKNLGVSIIRENPKIYARNHIISVMAMMVSPMRSSIDVQLGFSPEGSSLEVWRKGGTSGALSSMREITSGFTFYVVLFQLAAIIITYILVAAAVLRLLTKKAGGNLILPLIVIAYFIIVSGGPEAYARFRTPIVPFIAMLCGAGTGLAKRT